MKRPFGRATWGTCILQAENSIFMNHQPVRSILHVRNVYQAITSPCSRGHCSPFMAHQPTERQFFLFPGCIAVLGPEDGTQVPPRETSGREKGPSHSHSRKEGIVCFLLGGEIIFKTVPKKQEGNDGIPGMKYIYYLYLVVRKWIVCSAPETKDIPIETCFPKRDNIF